MKKIRYLPFGYRIANGNYEIVQEERQLVRQIFSQYLEGSSLLQLAEMAQRSGIPYRENAALWNKNMIARMLDDTRYWQGQRLPPLVDEETAAAVIQLRRKKATPPCPIQAVRAKLVCCGCGGPLLRVSKNVPRIRWDCKTCGRRFGPVTDRDLLAAIQVRLEALCQNPSLAEVPLLPQPTLSMEAVRLTHEIQRAFMERGGRYHPSAGPHSSVRGGEVQSLRPGWVRPYHHPSKTPAGATSTLGGTKAGSPASTPFPSALCAAAAAVPTAG